MNVELKNISFSYNSKKTVLKNVSLIIKEGESVAIIGRNGTGKTTLVKQLNGILRPTCGDILYNGESIIKKTTAQLASKVGYVFQNPDDQLFLSTVKKELEFGPNQIKMDKQKAQYCIKKAVELCSLSKYLESHPLDLGTSEKKFCTIASVLSMDPMMVIFDEPTMGQDRKGIERLGKIIKFLEEQGKTCIIISHDMKFVIKYFKRIIVMKDGEVLLDGTPKEVFSQPEILKDSFVIPPPITRVCQKCNIGNDIFTIEEFKEQL